MSLLLVVTTLSCYATDIRVRNDSNIDFKEVVVGKKKYGDIKRGQATEYQHWDSAYKNCAVVSLLADSTLHRLQPMCYVGEPFLGEGKFTYVLTLKEGHLAIRAQEDAK